MPTADDKKNRVNITEAWLRKHAPDELAGRPPRDLDDEVIADRLRVWDEELKGFGVVLGQRFASFFVRARVDGIDKKTGKPKTMQRDIGIGRWARPGAGDDHGDLWTEPRARKEARRLLGLVANDIDPVAEKTTTKGGHTLRDGVEAHLKRMEKKKRAARSIQTFKHETSKYLAPWLDTPINDLDVVAIQEQVKASVAARKNTLNATGAAIGNRVLAHISASWRSLNKSLKGKLGNWNPAAAADKDTLKPKRQTVTDLPNWAARVATMHSPIRRDGLMLALYTGLRHEDVRSIRFEHVNFDERTLDLPDPKGGEAKAFSIPLSKTPLEILKRRLRENARDIERDHEGWAFAAVDLDGNVGPISNLRQKSGNKDDRFPAEDVHTLRRTYISIANDEGISELDQMVLSNHAFAAQSVHRIYVKQHADHLARCATKIDEGITRRLKATSSSRRRRA